ncbi:ABC transporter ATP-binding protein [Nannocystis radixulma]|uniref:ABC transporter ATP-binding protein n=1 Tax=Nannocystis radixulma TaxID=2995305 RepID=A0ABT5BK47_9BACT|nr:ABC transporter ATP-binding protein [Nannocystis radixulma]MDC0673311.1 ABC transporter ATP-binding protein [Nannocystis radixulma]
MSLATRFFHRYVRRNLPQYALGFAMLVATNYAVVRIPTLIGNALDALGGGKADALAVGQGIALELIVWALAVVVVRTLSRVLFFNPGREVEYRVSVDLFSHLLALQRPFFLKRKVGELVSMATNDTMSIRLLIGFAGLQVCNVIVAVPLHLGQMILTDAWLTLWCLLPIAIGSAYTMAVVRRFYSLIRVSFEELGRLSDRVLESYAGIGTVRAHAAEAAILRHFDERNQAYLDLQLRLASMRAFSMPVLGLSGQVAAAIVLWVGGARVIAGELPVGALVTFTTLLASLVALLMAVAWVLASVSRGIVAIKRVDEVVATPDGLPVPTDSLPPGPPPALELRGLTFTYPGADEPSLRDISFALAPGKTLGIFGRTGAGKSTLIHLLSRVYTPPSATVFVAGKDVTTLPLDQLRAGLAVVPQDPFLFSTTLRDNIRLRGERTGHVRGEDAAGSASSSQLRPEEADDPRLQQVLRAACLVDDIRSLPEGLDTVVGERGVMLSGGQRQRTALARALYRGPGLLLLDDVLSAVDQGTEVRLVAAIRGLHDEGGAGLMKEPATTVIVSHRTSVLEHADEILVLERGAVVERGTHAQLIAFDGVYAETHRHQEAAHHG